MKPRASKEKIVLAAERLFNDNGVHSTGIDRIIKESGVAKKTFYHHFPSKNDLIAEYFRRKDLRWFERLEKFAAKGKTPQEKTLFLFDALKEWFQEPDFQGCPFIRGLSEFNKEGADPKIRQCLDEHFSRTTHLVEALLKEGCPKEYKKIVPQILSLICGATVLAHATGDVRLAKINKKVALELLEKHTRK